MSLVVKLILLIAIGELIIHFMFFLISKLLGKANRDKITRSSILKGLIERAYVLITLWYGFSSALTLLGALKIATRIKDSEDKVSNDFFLLGNLMSVLFGILYYVIIKNLVG